VEFYEKSRGLGVFLFFSFSKGLFFFFGWGGEEGGDTPSYPKGIFFLPLGKGKGMGEVFLFKCRDLFNEGLFFD
jgi:hypothetical protein